MNRAVELICCFFSAVGALLICPPLLILIFGPISLYREVIVLLAKVFRPDLLKIVARRDAVFASDDCGKSPKSTIVMSLEIKGNIDIETLRENMLTRVVLRANSDGVPIYPELQQYFVKWGGYMFRKQEQNFQIQEHVKLWKGGDEPRSDSKKFFPEEEDLYKIRSELLTEPFSENRSPWELILVQGKETDQNTSISRCVIVVKFHHGVADGFSLLNIFLRLMVDKAEADPTKNLKFIQRSRLEKSLFFFKAFLLTPYALAIQTPSFEPANPFSPVSVVLSGKRHPVWDNFPVSTIKQIARQTRTSFTAVLMAGLMGGIETYLRSNKATPPKVIDVALPLPWPGHPDKPRNYFTFATIELPCDNEGNIQSCLLKVHEILLKLKKSVIPTVNFGIVPITGTLPIGALKSVLENTPSSILMSSFPGPQTRTTFFEHDLIAPYFEGGYGQSPLGMGVSMLTFEGGVYIAINPDAAIIPTREESMQLLSCITSQYNRLMHDYIV